MENAIWILCVVFFGAVIGSFLSVCIYRIPVQFGFDQEPDSEGYIPETRSDPTLTISYPPRSFCPKCKAQLRWFHNIPVLSWLFLGGRCGFCKAGIPVRYPAIELLSAFFCILSFLKFGFTSTAVLVYIFCCALIVISFIDYDFYIIPDIISLPATLIGFIVAGLNQFYILFSPPVVSGFLDALYGVAAGAGFLFIVAEIYFRLRKKEGLGMGDVKLLAMSGAFFGPTCALYTIFIGSLLGSVLGVVLLLARAKKLSQEIPFGPYLALATILYLFTDDFLLRYLADLIAPAPY